MNPSSSVFQITPQTIIEAEQEKDRLEQVINDAQRKHGVILQFLRLAALYKKEEGADAEESPAPQEEVEEIQAPEPPKIDASNVMGTLTQIANESAKPLAKKELRAALIAAGVDKSRVSGPYFYVAIDRLKKKERISVLDDGRIWKALPKN